MGTYRTIAEPLRFAPEPTKGSRFLASVAPAVSEAEALAFVEAIRAELPDASHHTWAFRLREDGRARSFDDGEPGGSAGRPILAQIEGHDLHDVVAVVSRWFGGTKLGVGGLIRAYGGAAGMALDRAAVREVADTEAVVVEHDYPDTNAVEAVLAAEGLAPEGAEYGAAVRFVLQVPVDERERILAALRDRTAGRVRFPEG